MAKYISNRQKNIKVGIVSYTESNTVLEVTGRVGIGTTNASTNLDVNGGLRVRGTLYDGANSAGSNGQVLSTNGSITSWTNAAPSNAITGITIRDEGSTVGSANSISIVNFVGPNVTATATGTGSTITIADYVSISGYSTNAGIATNLKGGAGGSIPYQTAADTTALLANSSTAGFILQSNGGTSAPSWVAAAAANAITGITIRDEGSTVGSASSVAILNFVGPNVTATATGSGSTITIADYVSVAGVATNVSGGIGSVTRLTVSGVSTFTNGPVLIGSGTSTGTASQPLQVTGGAYVSGSVGIGTTNPTSRLTVSGNASISGILTADQVYTSNNGAGQNIRIGDDFWIGDINVANTTRFSGAQDSTKAFIVFGTSDTVALGRTGTGPLYYGGDFTISGVATANSFRARGGAPGGLGVNNNGYGFFGSGDNDSGMYSSADGQIEFYTNSTEAVRIDGNQRVGIGTTNPTSRLTVSGDVRVSGVATASRFVSNVATGTAPLTVSSTTKVTNLNADLLDDNDSTYYTNASNLSSGIVPAARLSSSNNFTVGGDLNVTGNISIGGTTAILNAATLQVKDKDIVLGITTNASNQDVSTDFTANHGGIAIASTEGTPLIDINGGVGTDSIASTYKQIMWLKSDSWAGLNTDAWLFNYGVGIGSTQVPNGVRLAVGGVQFTQNDLSVVRNINASGIVTATSFYGSGANLTGIQATSLVGVATYAETSGVSTNVSGGIGSVTRLTVSGISTFGNITGTSANFTGISTLGVTSATNLTSQQLNVSGVTTSNAYLIGATQVISSARQLQNIASLDATTTATIESAIANAPNTFTNLQVSGISTLGVTSATNLTTQQLNVSGVSTLGTVRISSGIVTATSGIVTYYGDGSKLTNIISGVGINTAGGNVGYGATLINFVGSGISFASVSAGIATINISGGGGGSVSIAVTNVTPPSPAQGNLWYNTNLGRTFIYYSDGSSSQWVDAAPFNVGIITTATAIGVGIGSLSSPSVYFTSYQTTGFYSPAANQFGIVSNGSQILNVNPSGVSVSGVVTATTFSGALSGNATTASSTPYWFNQGVGTNEIKTGTGDGASYTTYNVAFRSWYGIGFRDYTDNATVNAYLDCRNGNFGTKGKLLAGNVSDTGTASQNLQVSGGAYVSGSVGIGTTNPLSASSTLHINNASYHGVSGDALLRLVGVGGATYIQSGITATSGSSAPIVFTNIFANNEWARFTSSGNLLVGSQTSTGTASQLLQVTGGAYVSGNLGIGTTNPTSKLHVVGNVLVTGITTSTDFNSSSDINLKDNIQRIQNPIDKVLQLDGVTFNWKETNRESVGVIAQQVEKVLPQLVGGNETKTVNYNGLIGLLVEAVKDQQEQINILKQEIETLKK